MLTTVIFLTLLLQLFHVWLLIVKIFLWTREKNLKSEAQGVQILAQQEIGLSKSFLAVGWLFVRILPTCHLSSNFLGTRPIVKGRDYEKFQTCF